MPDYEAIANSMYPGIRMFARDVNLTVGLAEKYTAGKIVCEKGFTDASCRFMGMGTTHRFVILSNHMADFSRFEQGTNWGLFVAQAGAHFKVLGQHTESGRTGIFLLHLPDDENWKVYKDTEFSIDEELFRMAVKRFAEKCVLPAIPELMTEEWQERCRSPLGMNAKGDFFPLEEETKKERTEEKGIQGKYIYYLGENEQIVKVNRESHACFRLEKDGCWHADTSLGTELAWDGFGWKRIDYTENLPYYVPSGPVTEYRIGRGSDNDILLSSPKVSRNHALLWYDGQGWIIRDQESTNGILILREKEEIVLKKEKAPGNTLPAGYKREERLVPGDKLVFGDVNANYYGDYIMFSPVEGPKSVFFRPEEVLQQALAAGKQKQNEE